MHLLNTGTYLIAVLPACNSFPTLVINNAGKNNLTHIFEISREEEDLRILVLEAITPQPMVRRTAKEAWTAPRELGRMPLGMAAKIEMKDLKCQAFYNISSSSVVSKRK